MEKEIIKRLIVEKQAEIASVALMRRQQITFNI